MIRHGKVDTRTPQSGTDALESSLSTAKTRISARSSLHRSRFLSTLSDSKMKTHFAPEALKKPAPVKAEK